MLINGAVPELYSVFLPGEVQHLGASHFCKLALIRLPFSQNGRRGAGFKVTLPLWERDLG